MSANPIVIAVASQKGGVGKSTLTTQFAYCSALKLKKKTLLVDFDAQGNSTTMMLGYGNYKGTPSRYLFQHDCPPLEPHTDEYGIDVIGCDSRDNREYSTESSNEDVTFLPAENLSAIAQNYDYIWLDCPPSLGPRLKSALFIADFVVCPVRLGPVTTDGVISLREAFEEINRERAEPLHMLGMIVNDFVRTGYSMVRLQVLREDYKDDMLFKNTVQSRSPVQMSSHFSRPIWEIPNAKVATDEILAVFHELQSKIKSYQTS